MEIHEDAVVKGERVIVVDDLIATGGTAEGAVKLLRKMGAEVVARLFRHRPARSRRRREDQKLGVPVRTLMSFEGH